MLENFITQERDLITRGTPFLDDVRLPTWMDATGVVASLYGGVHKKPAYGLIGFGIAILPEIYSFFTSLPSPDISFRQASETLLLESFRDGFVLGGCYFIARLVRAGVDSRHR